MLSAATNGRKLCGRYTPIERLGAGGQGEVWRARDEQRGVDVALKVLSPALARNESAWLALEREYEVGSKLDHPSVLKVFPPQRDSENAVLPMELATGGDLRRLRGSSYLEIVPVLIELAQALEHAHERGIVHRDLKPSNVLFDSRGRVRLADFGVAAGTALSSQRDAIRSGMSPFTASPEQLRGEPPAVSDDVYGLGALAYELLSGYPPYYPKFDLKRVLEEPVPEIRPVHQAPPRLIALVMAMLAKKPTLRPRSMRDVLDDLDATLNDTLTFDFEEEVAMAESSEAEVEIDDEEEDFGSVSFEPEVPPRARRDDSVDRVETPGAAPPASARSASERAALERVAAERAGPTERDFAALSPAERAAIERVAAERAAAERTVERKAERSGTGEKSVLERVAERLQSEQRTNGIDRTVSDRALNERSATDRALAERSVGERAAAERLQAERAAAERAQAERSVGERAAAERIAAAERAAAERIAAERQAAERANAERIAAEREAANRRAMAERAAADRAALERAAADRAAMERAAAERAANERAALERANTERLAAERAAADRAAVERANERAAYERANAERLAAERATTDRLAAERAAAEHITAIRGPSIGSSAAERFVADRSITDPTITDDRTAIADHTAHANRRGAKADAFDSTADVRIVPPTPPAGAASGFDDIRFENVPSLMRLEPVRTRRWPWAVLILLIGIAGGAFYWLPRFAAQNAAAPPPVADATSATQPTSDPLPEAPSANSQTASAPTQSVEAPVAAPAADSPSPIDSGAEERMQKAREQFDEKLAALDARNAGVWGGKEYAAAKARSAEAVGAFDAGNPRLAAERLEDALRLLGVAESRAPQALASQINTGERALEAGDSARARQAFEFATRIDPSNKRAADGLRRARGLNSVLPLLADAANAESAKDYARAAEKYREVLAIDSANAKARAGLERASSASGESNYSRAVGQGFAALGAGRFEEARDAFEQARRINPSGREASEGLNRVSSALRARDFSAVRARAASLETEERWAEALDEYEAVLRTDPSLTFAQQGRNRAAVRKELAERLQNLIDSPSRLAAPAVRSEALRLLDAADAASPSGPVLRSQMARLQILLPEFDKPVRLALESDNTTQVAIQRVGSFGTFSRREIELKPGKYTVVGTRAGYRDVRRDVTIAPGQDVQIISVRCVEPI
jgi:hypothetical protein